MALKINTENGVIVMDEGTGEILTQDVLRSRARQYALEAGINPDIFEAQIGAESNFDPNAISPAGATGIAQIMPNYHPGVDATDPIASLQYAANLMANHLRNYGGDYSLALAAYNAGPGAVQQYGGVPPFAETQNYINNILGASSGMTPSGNIQTDRDIALGGYAGGASSAVPDDGSSTTSPGGGGKRVVDVINLGGGKYQYQYSDGSFGVVDTSAASTSGATAGQQIAAGTAAQSLAEQKRQFDLLQGERKAREDQEMRLKQGDQEIGKGNTLLGLGSRPDTLIKYLYALRGQQTPQGLQNTAASLPGYGAGAVTSAAPLAPAATAAAPLAPAAPVTAGVSALTSAMATPGAPLGGFVAPGGTNITPTMPIGQQPAVISGPATATQGATEEQMVQQRALIEQGRVPRFYSNGVAIFGKGGPIPEPVAGIGLVSGQKYLFGENGPEHVVPGLDPDQSRDEPKGVKAAARRQGPHPTRDDISDLPPYGVERAASRPMHPLMGTTDVFAQQPNLRVNGVNSYAEGGTIGYGSYAGAGTQDQFQQFAAMPGPAPMSFAPPGLFNPAPADIFSNVGGQFPQVSALTGGGASLIPSVQKLNQALPSEQGFYSGFLQDEAGVVPEDVFELARRLNPGANAGAVRGSRYA